MKLETITHNHLRKILEDNYEFVRNNGDISYEDFEMLLYELFYSILITPATNVKIAVLTNDSVREKVNLYYLIYRMLKDSDEESALVHAKLFLALKLESGANVPEEIEELYIDEIDLDIDELESEIRAHWSGYDG